MTVGHNSFESCSGKLAQDRLKKGGKEGVLDPVGRTSQPLRRVGALLDWAGIHANEVGKGISDVWPQEQRRQDDSPNISRCLEKERVGLKSI